MEIRNESFLTSDFIGLLREHNVALVIAETARQWPMPRDVTADFMYLRLHGDQEIYRSGYRAGGHRAVGASASSSGTQAASPQRLPRRGRACRSSADVARTGGSRRVLLLRQHGREAARAARCAGLDATPGLCKLLG